MTTVRNNTISITVRNGRGAAGADGVSLGDITLGAGVEAALEIGVGNSGAIVTNGGALGTPTSGDGTNLTGIPVSGLTGGGTGVLTAAGNAVNTNGGLVTASAASIASGAILTGGGSGTAISAITPGTGISTFLATPSSANLKAALTDETGSGGAAVFATGPTITGLALAAGSTSVAPINLASGTNLTTPAAGAMEYDGDVGYFTNNASNRGVLPSEHFVILTSTNTLTSQTGAQALFDGGGGPANGEITLPTGTFFFECIFSLSSMSSSSGGFGFALGGTATFSQMWHSLSNKIGTLSTADFPEATFSTAANTAIYSGDTSTSCYSKISGIIRVTVTGTVIPQVSLGVAAAAVVGVNSYFRIWKVGAHGAAYLGNWS